MKKITGFYPYLHSKAWGGYLFEARSSSRQDRAGK
jgi:hypothetical protein